MDKNKHYQELVEKGVFLDMHKWKKKIFNGTDETQYPKVLRKWIKKLSSDEWDKELLEVAIDTNYPLDYVNAMQVEHW